MSRTRSSPLYGTDLARIHHQGYGDFATEAAPGLLALLRRAGVREGHVVDLGCGSGIWLRALSRAGYRALGVDPSPTLAGLARRLAPAARVRVASAYELPLPTCDAVTAIGEVLSYCPPDGTPKPALAPFLRRVAAALRPGGVLAFDLMVTAPGPPMNHRTWRSGPDWAVLVEITEDRRRRRLVREITSFRATGSGYRRSHERHVLEVARRADVERWLRAAGFSVRVARRYGRRALPPRRLAFLARRR